MWAEPITSPAVSGIGLPDAVARRVDGGRCTVVTEKHGALRGRRVVRGREDEVFGVG